jgi:hypothetical protein
MEHRSHLVTGLRLGVMALLLSHVFDGTAAEAQKGQDAIVAAELNAIANQLALRPETAIDLSAVSGEYCFNTGIREGGHMTHYAIDPTKTQEDVIDFVNAEPLLQAGMNVEGLPRFPGTLGHMTPKQWYFLPAGEQEPHHGITFSFPLLIRASNLE